MILVIVDYYYPNNEWEGVGRPSIYTRYRGKDGDLVVHTIDANDEDPSYIPPHCWIPQNTNHRRLSRVTARYPGTRVRNYSASRWSSSK